MYDLEDYEKRTPGDRSLSEKIQGLETRDFIPGIGFASSLSNLQDLDSRLMVLTGWRNGQKFLIPRSQ